MTGIGPWLDLMEPFQGSDSTASRTQGGASLTLGSGMESLRDSRAEHIVVFIDNLVTPQACGPNPRAIVAPPWVTLTMASCPLQSRAFRGDL